MANIKNVVQVQLLKESQLAQRANMNVVALITSENTALNSNDRSRIYKSAKDVENDFGTLSKTYQFASLFFQQTPNATNANGYLVISYWRSKSEKVPATSAKLVGGVIDDSIIANLRTITKGTLNVTIDSKTINLTNIDFSTILTLDDVVGILDSSIMNADVSLENNKIVIKSLTTGTTSKISFVSGTGADYVGSILKLDGGSGAVISQGAASVTLNAETKTQALENASLKFKSFVFIDQPTDAERENLATYAQTNKILSADVFSGNNYLSVSNSNVVWKIKLKSQSNYRMFYDKNNDRKLALAFLARMQTTIFTATNTANTGNLKTLIGILPSSYTETEITNAYNVGLDVYTTIKDIPVVLSSPANDFFDNVYNLMSYIDSLQIDVFNLLKGTNTKIPQTVKGINAIVTTIEKTTQHFVKAGVFGAGTWSSPDNFGDLDTFLNAISTKGFYVYANSLASQPQSERQARLAPVIQIAVKNSGAVHKANLIVNFNI